MTHKKTKIVCTIGPASGDYDCMKKLAQAGMNVARLNMSHGTQAEQRQRLKNARKISKELGKPLAVMVDLQGPKLRLGALSEKVEVKKGQKIQFALNPIEGEIPIQFDLAPHMKKGQRVYINDGLVGLKVSAVKGHAFECDALNDGWFSSNKGINVPDTIIKGAALTQKDQEDLEFGLKEDADYIALSFVQSPEDIKDARKLIKKAGSKALIIAKIETKAAIENIEEIIKEVDVIMVARGDLGIEIPAAEVPIAQQKMIRLCRQNQKPVFVATQMLESMTENPRPTRAEVSDVANAVLDQVDAVMLSAETSAGKYPVESVQTMKDIILSVESNPEYNQYIKINWENIAKEWLSHNALVSSAASIAFRINAKAIVVPTATGQTVRLLSSFRPNAQIVAVAHDEKTMNQLALVWGIRSVVTEPTGSFDKFLEKSITTVVNNGFAKKGDHVVVVTGSTVGLSGSTDIIKIVTI